MLKNILVATGGFGSRLNGYKNPYKNKGLIKDQDGVTLLEHTLRAIKKSNCTERVILASRPDISEMVSKIADSVGINYKVLNHNGLIGLRALPVLFRNELEGKPFGLICGHAPFNPEHLQKMLSDIKSETDEVVSLYKSRNEELNKIMKVKINNANYYIESPYILNTNVIDLIEKDKCAHWLGYYINQQLNTGTKVYGVEASFPVESDTPEEIDQIIDWLKYKDLGNRSLEVYQSVALA